MSWARSLTTSLVALALAGCALWRPASVPLRTLSDPARCAIAAVDTLLVLLPGSYSRPEEYLDAGFVRIVRERRMAADILLVDAHVGYYRNRSVVTRLVEDVVQPARARGYRHVWLVGISIGAVGAMLYADARPGDVDGVVLLAPYLGTPLTAREIERAGGLAAWRAPEAVTEGEVDPILWRWLQAQTGVAQSAAKVPLLLGYGLDDRFAYNDAVLGAALPAPSVYTTPGGHDWPVWTALWRRIVDALPVPVDASCAQG